MNHAPSCEIASPGVFAGATRPNQMSASKSLKPNSATVGTFGIGSIRAAEAVASARSFPVVINSATLG